MENRCEQYEYYRDGKLVAVIRMHGEPDPERVKQAAARFAQRMWEDETRRARQNAPGVV